VEAPAFMPGRKAAQDEGLILPARTPVTVNPCAGRRGHLELGEPRFGIAEDGQRVPSSPGTPNAGADGYWASREE